MNKTTTIGSFGTRNDDKTTTIGTRNDDKTTTIGTRNDNDI